MPNVSVKLTFTQTEISFSGAWISPPPQINPEETLSLITVRFLTVESSGKRS